MDYVTLAKKEYRLMEWAGLVRERAESGETVKEFCAAHGLATKTYYYRPRKAREAAIPTGAAEVQAVVPVAAASRRGVSVVIHSGELTAELGAEVAVGQLRSGAGTVRTTSQAKPCLFDTGHR